MVYEWIAERVHGRKVVDLACGEGYGSAVLARSAHSVVGVDDVYCAAIVDRLRMRGRLIVSVAVSIPAGLITPIIVGADTKSVSAISTEMKVAWPATASSIELSMTSAKRWCSAFSSVPPIYMPGRRRTGSSPSRTSMSAAV